MDSRTTGSSSEDEEAPLKNRGPISELSSCYLSCWHLSVKLFHDSLIKSSYNNTIKSNKEPEPRILFFPRRPPGHRCHRRSVKFYGPTQTTFAGVQLRDQLFVFAEVLMENRNLMCFRCFTQGVIDQNQNPEESDERPARQPPPSGRRLPSQGSGFENTTHLSPPQSPACKMLLVAWNRS